MKRFTYIIFLAIFSISAYAQKYPGFTVGFNIASLTGDSTELDYQVPRFGAYLGLIWDVYIDQSTYMQFGVTYSQQGAKFYSEYYSGGYLNKDVIIHKIDYLQFPLVWKQRWSAIYTEIGGYIGFIPTTPSSMWYKYVYYRDSIHVTSDTINSFVYYIRRYDLGPIFGIGYQFKLSQQFDAYINFRYKPGLIKLNKGYIIPAYEMNNQVFTFNIGLISIGKALRHNRYLHKRKK